MANDGTVKIGVELDEKELEKSFKNLDQQAEKTSNELKKIDDALKLDPSNVDLLIEKQKLLTSAVEDSKDKVEKLAKELKNAKDSGLQDSDADAYRNLVIALSNAESEAKSFERQLDDVTQKIKNGGKEAKDFSSELSKLGSVASTALKGGIAVIGSVATAASGAVAGLLALESATEEYRIAQGKLNTAFEAAGYGTEAAAQAYNAFYGILGDTDTATEASQLLAKLAESQEDLSTWTNIAAGVYGTFGDSLPIEGLIESANETAKVGQVVGVLADSLNWAGISEDEFNEKLAACTTESERNQLIMDTLAGTYDEASDAFYRNNQAIIESRNAQAQMDESLSKLGDAVLDVKTRMTSEFLPAISQITEGFAGMLTGTEGAEEQFSEGITNLIDSAIAKLPEFLNFGVQILSSIASGIIQNIPVIVSAIPSVISGLFNAIVSLLPQLADAGVQILTQIATGVEKGLPNLISQIPVIIEEFISNVEENLPQILETGVSILTSIINGIIDSIPALVDALPRIIIAITDFIANNAGEIFMAGVEIVLAIIKGLIGTIPELVASIPQLIEAMVKAFTVQIRAFLDIGKAIVEGIWEGISSMVSWIGDKISGFVGGIVDNVKGLLGIHSHSALFRDEIGKNIGLGVAEGIEESADSAKKAANDLVKDLESAIPAVQMGVSYANASMTPSSVSTPRFSMETAMANAAGLMAMSQGSSSREIVLTLNGREVARGLIDNIRMVEMQTPAIQFN